MSEDDAQDASTPEEGTGTSSSFKDKFATFKERTKEATSVAGSKAKSFAAQASEVTKEAAEVASEKSVKLAKQASKATKEAAAATGAKSKEIAQKAAEVTKKAADKTSVAVSSGLAQAKESVAEAKERRQATKDATTIVVESGQIDVGPDILDEEEDTEVESPQNTEDFESKPEERRIHDSSKNNRPSLGFSTPMLESNHESMVVLSRTDFAGRYLKKFFENLARHGPDLLFGWILLFIAVGTLANTVAMLTEDQATASTVFFGIPHFEVAFESESVWVQALGGGLLFLICLNAIGLSFTNATKALYLRIGLSFMFVETIPFFDGGIDVVLEPFGTDDVAGILWHLLMLPSLTILSLLRWASFPNPEDDLHVFGGLLSEGSMNEKGHYSSAASNITAGFNDLIPMSAQNELMSKPGRRDKFDLYEKILLPLTLLLVFASVAMTIIAAIEAENSTGVLSSAWMVPIVMCLGLTVIFAIILMRMDKSARSGTDMAKRRERYNAMQDEFWETQRTEFRLRRESMEQGAHGTGTPSDA